MAKINLLPWREALRAEREKRYMIALTVTALVAVLLVLGGSRYIQGEIENQQARNQFMQREIAQLDAQIKEILGLRKRRDELIDRMKVIQSLQGNRPVIVRLVDELVRTLPDGVYYTSLDKQGEQITIQGVAKSNNRVSALMRNFDRSEWFANPNLLGVKAFPEFGEQANSFNLLVQQKNPDAGEAKKQ